MYFATISDNLAFLLATIFKYKGNNGFDIRDGKARLMERVIREVNVIPNWHEFQGRIISSMGPVQIVHLE